MNKAPLIGLVGRKRAGKDTVAEALGRHGGYHRLAFADRLKEVVLDINPPISWDMIGYKPKRIREYVEKFGWEQAKYTPEVRRLLQVTGVAVRQHLDEDAWVRPVMLEAYARVADGQSVVVTDVRFPNEYEAFRRGEGVLLRVARPDSDLTDLHVSETSLDGWPCDFILTNDGSLEDLDRKVRQLLEHLNTSTLVQV